MRFLYDTVDIPQHPLCLKEPHHAWHNHTGHPTPRASTEARGCSSVPLWLSLGLTHLPVVCSGASSDRDRGVPVLRTLQCVPHRTPLPCGNAWLSSRHQRGTGGAWADDGPLALDATRVGRLAHDPTTRLWLVSDALEWRDLGDATPGQTRDGRLGLDGKTLAP